jgi:hypothetical protein
VQAAGAAKTIGKVLVAMTIGAALAFVHSAASEVASTIVVPAWRKWFKKIRKFRASEVTPSVTVNFAQAQEEEPAEEPECAPEAPCKRGRKKSA